MSEPVSRFLLMTNIQFPKSPAQVYRETTAQVVAYNTGVVLRIIWEVSKPILKWTAIIALGAFVGFIYLIWQLVFGTIKR